MRRYLKKRGPSVPIAALALVMIAATPAWATTQLPGPVAGGLVGSAIVGVLVVAKLWRRK